MENVKVSVIIPINNVENYLKNCLESIIHQTLQEIEIICVNDGSTDGSQQILEEYAQNDDRIQIINKENVGAGAARNTGMEVAKGEYIGFIDSDDWIELDTYEKFYKNAKSQNSDIVMCPINLFDDSSHKLTKDDKYDLPYFTLEYLDKQFDNRIFNYKDTNDFLFRICVAPWNKIYRTEFLTSINAKFPENLIFEDMPFFYETYLQAHNVSLIRDFLYFYRINRPVSIKSKADKNFFDIIKINDLIKKIFIDTQNFEKFNIKLLDYFISSTFHNFNLIDEIYKQEFFEVIKLYFENMHLEDSEIDKLSLNSKNNYQNVINSDTKNEFELREKVKSLKLTYKKNLKYQEQYFEEQLVKYKKVYEEQLVDYKESHDKEIELLKFRFKNKLTTEKQSHEKELSLQKQAFEKKLEDIEEILKKMDTSNSWKLTRPIRKIGTEIKRFKK